MVPPSEPSPPVDDPRARPIFYFHVQVLMPYSYLARIYSKCHRTSSFHCVAHRSCSLCCFIYKLVLTQHRSHALLLLSDPVSVKTCFLPFLTNPNPSLVLVKVFIQNQLQAFSLPLSRMKVSGPVIVLEDPAVDTGSKFLFSIQ